jgi:RNase P subunit RPR2
MRRTNVAGGKGGTMKATRKTVVDGVELWTCSKCGKAKLATDFATKTRKSGAKYPAAYCKPCAKVYYPEAASRRRAATGISSVAWDN